MVVYELWLPILLAGLATHVAATLAWTVLPHHKPEWGRVNSEDELLDWLAAKGVPPGQYLFPYAEDGAEMKSETYQEKSKGKCHGMLFVWPRPANMGLNIVLTLTFFLVTSFVIGYLASNGLERGATFMNVFQFVTTAGILAHVFAGIPTLIWFRRKCAMDFLDGLVYALITGLIFAALWPGIPGTPVA